jgi:hypothetical protein
VRDEVLPNLGVRLVDDNDKSDWKYDDPEEIRKSILVKKEVKRSRLTRF